MNLNEKKATSYQQLQTIAKELLSSLNADEINYNLEMLLSVYIQNAPVNQLALANTATIVSRLIAYITKLENALERRDLILKIESALHEQ